MPSEQLTGGPNAQIRIALEASPGSGAMWFPSTVPDNAILHKGRIVPDDSSIGGQAVQEFLFQASAAGTYVVVFELKRPSDNIVRRRHEVTIRID
jgi:hypothetical protein